VACDAVGEVPGGGVLEAEDVREEEDAGAVVVLDGLEKVGADAVVLALPDDEVRASHQLARLVVVHGATCHFGLAASQFVVKPATMSPRVGHVAARSLKAN
jgi:hypothetical protein